MNLSAYFERIAYDGPRVASRDALERIAYRHALSIPFENLDAFLGIRISLDPEAVAEKLITRRRGGWCFEQNQLLGSALREMGFVVKDLAARVLWGQQADAVTPRTHRVLQVRCDGRDWLVDAGFGGQSLTGVLDLQSDMEQALPHELLRLRTSGADRVLETRLWDQWRPMYRFDLQPQLAVDFEAANYWLSHDPASRFVTTLIAALPTPQGRHALRDGLLTWYDAQGNAQESRLDSTAQVATALREKFGINLAGVQGLEQRLAQMTTQAGTAARS
ncbi:MAG: arylamine N-acetyltransferase [Pseudomonadota bacterium]